MAKILNTDLFLASKEVISNNSIIPVVYNEKNNSFLYAMDDCTHLDFPNKGNSEYQYAMDDCTTLDFSTTCISEGHSIF